MTSGPMYTTKAAVVIGAVAFLGAGIAIGATAISSLIDSNSLKEYRENPKLTQWIALNDNTDGHLLGWNPIVGDQSSNYRNERPGVKYERLFTITDPEVETGETVLAFVVQKVHIDDQNDRGETLDPAFMDMPCMTSPFDGGFTLYCGGNEKPANGSLLRYVVLSRQ